MLSWLRGRQRRRRGGGEGGGSGRRPPPDDYQLVHTFSFSPSRRRRHKSLETLPRSDSMVSLCVRNLVNYITDDNLVGLQNFLENKRVPVDDRDENGTTALMVAACKGKLQFVREFINHEADVNAEDSDNWTALLCAAKEGYLDICVELTEHGADIEHRDMGGWTALMWATYKGHTDVANYLLEKKAEVNAHGNYHISSLLWAAGRGHAAIAKNLIVHGAKVNVGDKYGTTALVWACRKGNAEIVDGLLKAGANVDTAGMFSWTPLLVATLGNHVEVVNLLLDHKPNVNALDKDGCTALTLACKEGFHEIAVALLNVGAYINIQDRAGDTNLIHAVKGGHRGVVEALLKKYADVDICGKDRKTAVYWAVEKGNVAMVKLLLTANPDLEIATKDGDTPLLRAVRIRNGEIVQLLLDKKAKVSAADKKGDTALHIAMRARSKGIVEVLLRNPKNSQLLYRPNRSGETPYNIDMNHQKTILGQIFGARRLNTNEDNENMLGYDLYSSALADILSEPSLSMPITVGLYAKWGSGKSFLLNKLREEMKNFAKQWVDPVFSFTSLLLLVVVHVALVVGVVSGLLAQHWIVGMSTGGAIVLLAYTFLLLIWYGSHRYDWYWPYTFNVYLTRKLNTLKLVLQVMFCHPPGAGWSDGLTAQPIHFYFTDQTRVSSTTGGENSVVQMLGSLYDSIENDYGALATRLYRAFRPKPLKSTSSWKWRRLCCLPYFVIFELSFVSLLAGVCVLTLYVLDLQSGSEHERNIETTTAQVILVTIGLLLGIGIVANLYTWAQMLQAIIFSQRRHLQRAIARLDTLKSEGFLQALRSEVTLMTDMVKCLDSFTSQQTRLVVIVDGLDSCEQDKVLLVLDAVHMLFSDTLSPFIVILAIDPHVISKAVEVNSRRLFSESNIGGHDYLRNMVHLPFYLQNSGLRKVKVAQQTAQHHRKSTAAWNENEEGVSFVVSSVSGRRLSSESGLSSSEKLKPQPPSRKGSRKLKLSESVASSLGSNLNRVGGAHDLTKMLLTDDYFSEVNPRSMRRLMNVVYITGRLLKAFQIDFNWYHLASWINITEQWPYRTSWLILYYDMYEDTCEENFPLKNIYDKVRPQIPVSKEMEPLLELDKDERKFDIFLTFHRSSLLISDMKIFLPFTINLDPYIKKVIKEDQQNADDMGLLLAPHFPTSPPTAAAAAAIMANSSSAVPPNAWGNSKTAMLRRQRPLSRNSSLQSPTVAYPQPPLVNWPQSWMTMSQEQMPPMVRQSSFCSVPVPSLPMEVQDTKLSPLTVDGVCGILEEIEDLNPAMMSQYTSVIHDNNINGRVLLHCDLEELKKVLKMSFGDWEMFRVVVTLLRENEMNSLIHNDDYHNKNVRFAVPNRPLNATSQERKGGMTSKSSSQVEKEKPARSENRSSKQTIMEKQVTLEEQMICGALQTLNEEACEDVLDETEPRSVAAAASRSLVGGGSSELPGEVTALRSGDCGGSDGAEAEVLLLQSSPLQRAQPLAALTGTEAAAAIADGYVSGGGGSSCGGTPLQARRPPLPPSKESAQGPKGLLQRAGSTRSVSALANVASSSSAAKGAVASSGGGGLKARQRPASLLMLGDVAMSAAAAAALASSPPGSPKHHVAFRSHSAEDGSAAVPTKTSSSTSLLSSLRGRKSNTSLNDALLMTPASSAEKLNRLKDKLLRSVTSSPRGRDVTPQQQVAQSDETRDVELGLADRNGDLDSDDESTPLVSEMSSPGVEPPSAAGAGNASHFLNRGFSIAGASDSYSGSSENSPSSVKSTPLSSPPPAPKQESTSADASAANNGNMDTLPNGLGASNANLVSQRQYASSCGSTVSLSQLLEPASNYYHLVAVSGSASSVESGGARICARLSSQETLTDDELKLGPRKASNHSLARQDALDNPAAKASAKESDEEWQNPETTV